MRAPVPALLAAAFCACASTNSAWPPLDIGKLPTSRDHSEGIVVLLDSNRVEYLERGGAPVMEMRTHTKMKLLRDSGRDEAQLRVVYNEGLETVTSARARTITPDGREKLYGQSEMDDQIAMSEGVLFQGTRVLSLNFGSLPLGSYIEYEYKVELSGPERFQQRALFGRPFAVQHARCEVVVPKDWEIEHQVQALGTTVALEPKVNTTGLGAKSYLWEQTNIPAFREEPLGPSYGDALPILGVRLVKWVVDGRPGQASRDMMQHSQWLASLYEGTEAASPAIRATVGEILREVSQDPRAKAQRLYEWVQQQVRYIAVEVGIGGWRPEPAQEVFETRYGDCKGKANLLKTMLQVAGIESRVATIYSHDGFPRKHDAPVLGTTNHAILVIDLPDTPPIVVDPTSRSVPFGDLPLGDQGAEILPIAARGASLLQTPFAEPERNKQEIRLDLSLREDGFDVQGRFVYAATGAFASDLRRDGVQLRQAAYKENLLSRLKLQRGSIVEHAPVSDEAGAIRVEGVITARDISSGNDRVRLFSLAQVMGSLGRTLPQTDRRTPVLLRKREITQVEMRIQLKQGMRILEPLAPFEIESKFARYRLEWSAADQAITARATLEVREPIVPAESYPELVKFFDEVHRAEATNIVVEAAQ